MLEKIRKLLGGGEIPAELTPLYSGARNEREALILLKEARRRDEGRRRRAMKDVDILVQTQDELMDEGKGEVSQSRKLSLARRIKEIRWKIQELNGRIENIYTKRIRIFNEHIQSLETVLELASEELPDKKTMEEIAIRAKTLLEDLDQTKELAEGIGLSTEKSTPDSEEQEILREFEEKSGEEADEEEAARDAELEKEELPLPEEKKKEPGKKEPPEILYEE